MKVGDLVEINGAPGIVWELRGTRATYPGGESQFSCRFWGARPLEQLDPYVQGKLEHLDPHRDYLVYRADVRSVTPLVLLAMEAPDD